VGQANSDIQAIMARIALAYPDAAGGLGAEVVSLREQLTGPVRRPLLILVVAVCFVLLIACANIAGVLLSRATARRREIAVRAALGASRWRIVRQLLTESVLLGAAGGLLGTMLAVFTFSFLRQLIPAGLRDATSLELNLPVLIFSLAVSLLAGVFFGLAPALLASRTNLNSALKQGSDRTGFGAGQPWLRNMFVIGQVTLSLVLLIAAGLLIQTLFKLRGQYSELRPENVLTVRTQLSENRYSEHPKRSAFYSQVLDRVQRLPGVLAAGYTTTVPLVWKGGANGLTLEGRQQAPGLGWNANHRQISPDYFRAVGISLRQGRTFTNADTEDAQPVSIINETMAREYWPGENPIMKRFKAGSADSEAPWLTVVGVVSDVRQMGADAPVKPEMYVPYRQASFYRFFTPRDLVIRTAVPPSSLVPSVRQAIYEIDPYQPLSDIRTLDEVLGRETAQRRVGMILLSVFAGVALLLSALGIYGVLSYFVVQHTPEIGIRMALGANPIDVLRLVVGKGMRLAFAGVAAGLICAFMLTRLMQSVLYGVSATDPLTFCLIAVLLILVALAACLIPARRAAKLDPMIALRFE
jgi:putative ABC transport system permease protein